MALDSDAISLIQSIIVQNQQVAAFVTTALASRASTTIGVSALTEARQARFQASQATISTKLTDLTSLDTKLNELIKKASALRPSPTSLGSAMDVSGSSAASDTIDLDATASANLQTGDKVTFDTPFGSVIANTPYWVRRGTTTGANTTFTLYNTRNDALNNTNRINITTNGNQAAFAKQIKPEPETGIKDFFTAYNDVQTFLSGKLASGGSLADEAQIKNLPTKLSQAVVTLLKDANLGPALTANSSDDTITVNTTSLTSQISANPQSLASLFEDTIADGSGYAKAVGDIASSYAGLTGIIGVIKSGLTSRSTKIDTQLSHLTAQAEKEQAAARASLAAIAKSTLAVSLQISFVSRLAG